jgi:hypothetical protein
MAMTGQTLYRQRKADGYTTDCAQNKHKQCASGKGASSCACRCHAVAEGQAPESSRHSEAARKAWDTRRAKEAGASAETAPKRPELKSGAKSAIPAAAARQIKSEFAVLLWAADQGAAAAAPTLWTTPDDRLQEQERTALVNATYNEIEARFPELLKILAKAQESATEAALIYTVAMIAAPRLARHGVIPESFASAILFAPLIAQSVASREPGASAVGAEPAPQPDRANGYGQEHAGQPSVEGAPVHAGAAEQTRLGDLLNGSGDPDGARNGRYPQ